MKYYFLFGICLVTLITSLTAVSLSKDKYAFPLEGQGPYNTENVPGMSLREYYAGQAMLGIIMKDGITNIKHIGNESFMIADEMLKNN